MFKKLFISVVIALMPWFLQAQFVLNGKVVNASNGEALPGANVVLGKTLSATTTGLNGEFTFTKLKKGMYALKVSYVGFETYQSMVKLENNQQLNIQLKPKAYMSDEVIISAIRAGAQSPTTHENLSSRDIDANNMGQDLPYVLSLTPSVVVSSDAGAGVGYTGLRIRGVDLTGINVTLNGVPVNDAESQGVYFVDLPDLASSVDNIQIQRGVGTSSNGSAAFGASLNIKTDRFDPKAYAEYNGAYGSFNTFKNTLRFGSGLLNNHWLVNGRFSTIHSDGYIDRASSDLQSAYMSAAYYSKKDIFKAIVMSGKEKTYQAWYGVPKEMLETDRTYNPAGEIYDANGNLTGYYDNQTDNYRQDYYQLHYAHQFSEKLNVATAAFLTRGIGYYESYKNDQKFSKYGMNDTLIGGVTVNRTDLVRQKWLDNYFYGMNLSGNYQSKGLKLSFGGGWNQYDGDHYGKIVWAQVARLGDYNRNWYFNTGLKTDYHVFTKINLQVAKALSLMAEAQFRGIHYEIYGIHDDLRDLTQAHDFSFFNPRAGLFYQMNRTNQFYFSAAVSHREPNRSVYRDADPGQDVRAEKLYDFEWGYKLRLKTFSLNANVYYMDYKDQFVLTGQINNVGSAIMVNVPKSYRAGIELNAGWQLAKNIRWDVNATFSTNKIKDFTEYVDNWNYWDDPNNQPYQYTKNLGTTDISFSPDVVSGSKLSYKPFDKLSLAWVSKYVGRQYIDNTSNLSRSLDPYWVNNMLIETHFTSKLFKEIGLRLSLNNLFGESYETNAWVYRYVYNNTESVMDGYFPQAKFNFMLGFNIKF
jgi:iron complex outermembrane receptor protein